MDKESDQQPKTPERKRRPEDVVLFSLSFSLSFSFLSLLLIFSKNAGCLGGRTEFSAGPAARPPQKLPAPWSWSFDPVSKSNHRARDRRKKKKQTNKQTADCREDILKCSTSCPHDRHLSLYRALLFCPVRNSTT
jgi:hypothetical protein